MTDIVKHPATVTAAEHLRRRLRLCLRAFGPPSVETLELRIIELTRRVAALEAERKPRRRRP